MKRLRSLTIYQILPRAQDRSWGIKLNIEVHAELLARLKSLCKTWIKQTWVQRYSARLTSELSYICIVINKGWWWSLTAASQLWLSGYPELRLQCNSLRWHTRVHIFTNQYTTMDPLPSPYENAIHSTNAYLAHFRVSTFTCLWTVQATQKSFTADAAIRIDHL